MKLREDIVRLEFNRAVDARVDRSVQQTGEYNFDDAFEKTQKEFCRRFDLTIDELDSIITATPPRVIEDTVEDDA